MDFRNTELEGELEGVPTIVLCSHEALYREYRHTMEQGDRRSNNGRMAHFVSKPYVVRPVSLQAPLAAPLGPIDRPSVRVLDEC